MRSFNEQSYSPFVLISSSMLRQLGGDVDYSVRRHISHNIAPLTQSFDVLDGQLWDRLVMLSRGIKNEGSGN